MSVFDAKELCPLCGKLVKDKLSHLRMTHDIKHANDYKRAIKAEAASETAQKDALEDWLAERIHAWERLEEEPTNAKLMNVLKIFPPTKEDIVQGQAETAILELQEVLGAIDKLLTTTEEKKA